MKKKVSSLLFISFLCVFLLAPSAYGTTADSEESADTITLTLRSPGFQENDLNLFLEQYYPDFSLDIRTYPEEQFYTLLKTNLALGKGPDLMNIQPGYGGSNGVMELAAAGYLYPLYEEPEVPDNTLVAANGLVYGKSTLSMALGLVYNKRIFQEQNLTEPACWEDFIACCQTLSENGITPLINGGKDISTYQYALYQIAANQLYPSHPDYDEQLRSGQAHFTDAGTWDTVLSMYISLFENGYMHKDSLHLTNTEAVSLFLKNEAAMFITTSLNLGMFSDSWEEGDPYAFIPLPANSKGDPVMVSAAPLGCLGIYSESPYREQLRQIMMEFNESYSMETTDPTETYTNFDYHSAPSYTFCNQGWPGEVEVVLENRLSEYLATGFGSMEDILTAMQTELDKY